MMDDFQIIKIAIICPIKHRIDRVILLILHTLRGFMNKVNMFKYLVALILMITTAHTAHAMQQHILDLCRSEKKDNEHCKVITDIFKYEAAWPTMSLLSRIWHYNQAPMPRDLTRAVLMSNAKKFGAQMGWDSNRIKDEYIRLFHEYDKK